MSREAQREPSAARPARGRETAVRAERPVPPLLSVVPAAPALANDLLPRLHPPQREAYVAGIGRSLGNQRAERELSSARSRALRRREAEESKLEKVREMLNRVFVPEDDVIILLGQLTPAEKAAVMADGALRKRMVKAFNFAEMARAMTALKPKLSDALAMLRDASLATSAIGYHEIKGFIANAPKEERLALGSPAWRDFFVKVCTNKTMVEALLDLGLPLAVQLEWLEAEVGWVRAELSYADVQPLIQKAPQAERDALKTDSWRAFFMGVCDNKTIITAVKELNFDPLTRMEWILEEGNSGILLGGGIDPAQMYEALQDAFKGEALQFIELASLNNWKEEDQKRIRQIMDSKRDDRPAYTDELGDAAAKLGGPAGELLAKHTSVFGTKAGAAKRLDEAALCKELAGLLGANPALVRQVLELIKASKEPHLSDREDNVAVNTLEAVSDDEALRAVAKTPDGRALLLFMVRTLFTGVNMGDEEKQQTRVLKVVSDIDAEEREKQGAKTEVEVLTFLYGGKAMDWGGEKLGGFRGHTAVIVGDLVYSFEAGWSCGYTKGGYLAKNTFRDAIGQVLEVTAEDAAKLQANLNKSCGTGVYFAGGDICTGKASLALDNALKRKVYEVENPQLFVGYLESTGLVKRRNFYPKKDKP
jgi:hypothetical protein